MGKGTIPGGMTAREYLDACGLPYHWHARLAWGALGAWSVVWAVKTFSGCSNAQRPKTDFNCYLKQETKVKSKAPQPGSTSFDAYLKVVKPAPSPTSFDAYLRNATPEAGTSDESAAAEPESKPNDDQVVVTVLFGTEYGFAKEISEKLCDRMREGGKCWPRLMDMASVPSSFDFAQEQVILVVCSTQGDGVPPSEAREFCDWLGSSAAPMLPNTSFSVCALGDTSYNHFCACGKQLDARLAELQARRYVGRQDVNKEDWRAVDGWIQAVLDGLEGMQLQTVAEMGGFTAAEAGNDTRISKNRPYMGRVVESEGLCNIQGPEDKDTLRVEIDLGTSGLEYVPGDALGIHASNAPEVVEDLIDAVNADATSLVPLPTWHYADERHPPGSSISLRDVLARCYDLRVPKPEFLQKLHSALLAAGASSEVETPQLGEKAEVKDKAGMKRANGHVQSIVAHGEISPGGWQNGGTRTVHVNGFSHDDHPTAKQQVAQLGGLLSGGEEGRQAYLEPRHVVDVLSDFPDARLSSADLLPCLRPLQPRLYSISSSTLEGRARVQVTVAIVRYTSLKKERMGVASTFLAERLKVGELLPVYISKNPDFRLPPSPATPIIMVGPGTGLAPFRAFLKERELGGQGCGESLLYFGCRRRDQDYLYGNLLESWHQEGRIQLFTAFSREQKAKVYVQDRLRQSADKVWQLLEAGAHFYVCGDAAHMAAAVEEALLDIINESQGRGRAAAEAYFEKLQKEERYQRDVWL